MRLLLLLMGILLTSCSLHEETYAPVYDIATYEQMPKSGVYHVQGGETLYSIAFRYGLDYRYVAARNNILPPYQIFSGQVIYLQGKPSTSQIQSKPISYFPVEREPRLVITKWHKPAHGPIVAYFSKTNKGINIAGNWGDPVYASAPGKVVYAGSGLRRYGNLVILKHNSSFLTAYAYNSVLLVREGEWVHRGRVIAKMGHSTPGQALLHFEIRLNGQPVNPLRYLSY